MRKERFKIQVILVKGFCYKLINYNNGGQINE